MLISVLGLRAQDCIDYVLHFQSNVMAGGPVGAYYNITAANLSIGSGSLSFDSNQTEQWDTLCMTAGCNLTIIIDPAVMPSPNSFDFQIWALGSPLQFSNYTEENGVIQATFCCTAPCPSQIQTQIMDCNSYDFFVGANSGNVLWNFGDTSNDPMGFYQQHTFIQNGFYNVMAMVSIDGCGPEYVLTAPINVNCDTTLSCPTDLIFEPLSCHDYYLHFDVPVMGTVDWQIDGAPLNTMSTEIYVNWENGGHEVIAIYHPVGTEECMDNWPVTFWDTLTVACADCQDVALGISSVLDLGGPGSMNITLSNLDNTFLLQDYLSFTPSDPVADLSYCLSNDCYRLHICSPTPMADTNVFVDFVEPLVLNSQNNFYVEGCFGRDVFFSLNDDCSSPICDGQWMVLNVDAAYLTMPPFFSPDTLYWNVLDVNGIELAQGMVGVNDAIPHVSDSACIALPLTCYQITAWAADEAWGMTYANVNVEMADSTIYGMINPAEPQWLGIWSSEDNQNCFVSTENQMPKDIFLSPNPFQSFLNIPSGVRQIQVFGVAGNKVLDRTVLYSQTIDVSALPSGIWLIKILQDDGIESTQRIVKL